VASTPGLDRLDRLPRRGRSYDGLLQDSLPVLGRFKVSLNLNVPMAAYFCAVLRVPTVLLGFMYGFATLSSISFFDVGLAFPIYLVDVLSVILRSISPP